MKPVIRVEQMTRKFGDFVANDSLSFEVFPGEIFGFLGANGAGKTTAMKILCGLLKPTSGKIYVADCDVFTEAEKIKERIGYMSQHFSLYSDLTVWENIKLFGGIYGLKRAEIKERGENLIQRLAMDYYRKKLVKDLPLGWRQKLAFSIAVLHRPPVVFLDEPTGGVDPITRRQFWNLIYESVASGTTVFVTTHYMDEAEYCHRVSIMDAGRIIALDTPQKLKAQYGVETMDEVFIKIAR